MDKVTDIIPTDV